MRLFSVHVKFDKVKVIVLCIKFNYFIENEECRRAHVREKHEVVNVNREKFVKT